MEGCAWDVVSLLVAGGDETGVNVDAEVRLTESVAEQREPPAIGRDAENRAVVFADRCRLLVPFCDDELSAGSEP